MGDNCSVYMQIKAAISQMAALLYLSMSSAILRLQMHMAHFTKSGDLNPQAFKKHEKPRSRPPAQIYGAGGRLLLLAARLSLLAIMLHLCAIPYWYW